MQITKFNYELYPELAYNSGGWVYGQLTNAYIFFNVKYYIHNQFLTQ